MHFTECHHQDQYVYRVVQKAAHHSTYCIDATIEDKMKWTFSINSENIWAEPFSFSLSSCISMVKWKFLFFGPPCIDGIGKYSWPISLQHSRKSDLTVGRGVSHQTHDYTELMCFISLSCLQPGHAAAKLCSTKSCSSILCVLANTCNVL